MIKQSQGLKVLQFMLGEIFTSTYTQHNQVFEEIFAEHILLVENSFNGFTFKSEHYGKVPRDFKHSKALHPTLRPRMTTYLSRCKQLDQDRDYVKSYLQAVFTASKPLGQCYQAIPPSLHPILKNRGIERVDTPIDGIDAVIKYNQKGYDLLLKYLLLSIVS